MEGGEAFSSLLCPCQGLVKGTFQAPEHDKLGETTGFRHGGSAVLSLCWAEVMFSVPFCCQKLRDVAYIWHDGSLYYAFS